MNLDITTLSVVTVFVTSLLGALLVFGGLQNREMRSLMWWGAAYVIGGLGFGLIAMRGHIPSFVSIDLANALLLTCYGMVWAGARIFDGRRVHFAMVLIAPAIWLLACRHPALADVNLRIMVMSAMMAVIVALTAFEFWRGRAEPLMSRWPAIIVLLGYTAAMVSRWPLLLWAPFADDFAILYSPFFTLFSFATLLFTVVMAFLLLNMTKERTELRHRIASMVDPLTGVANRRAFFAGASELFARQREDGRPLAVLLFDLDHFKDVNDRLGHSGGDRVLKIFAETSRGTLGSDVLLVRLGGEEFAALLPVGDSDEAYAIADRVRRNFAATIERLGMRGPSPTVSAGIALGTSAEQLEAMMTEADRALYRAKAAGRNRVESGTGRAEAMDAPSIVPFTTVPGGGAGQSRVRRAAR